MPADHPLRAIRQMTDAALATLSPRFERLYASTGRPSIPPEQLLRALLLQSLYSVRSERLLIEQLEYNLLFRWFVGLAMDDAGLDADDVYEESRSPAVGRHRGGVLCRRPRPGPRRPACCPMSTSPWTGRCSRRGPARKVFSRARAARRRRRTIPSNPTVDFPRAAAHPTPRMPRRPTRTPSSIARATAQPAMLGYLGHVLMDNRHGLVADACVTPATGTAERDAAVGLLAGLPDRDVTVGADKPYDVASFVETRRGPGGHPPCRAEDPRQRDRCAHDAPSGLCDQSTETEARRAGIALDPIAWTV